MKKHIMAIFSLLLLQGSLYSGLNEQIDAFSKKVKEETKGCVYSVLPGWIRDCYTDTAFQVVLAEWQDVKALMNDSQSEQLGFKEKMMVSFFNKAFDMTDENVIPRLEKFYTKLKDETVYCIYRVVPGWVSQCYEDKAKEALVKEWQQLKADLKKSNLLGWKEKAMVTFIDYAIGS